MPLHMQRQMVTSGEGTLTKVALERTVSSVLAVMPRQFIRAGKLPATTLPVAVVGFLAGVCSEVSLEMGALGVGLHTARVRTGMTCLTLPTPRSATSLLGLCHLGLSGYSSCQW